MSDQATITPKNWREARRMRALALKKKGWKNSAIAEALGVSNPTVTYWFKQGDSLDAMREKPRSGRPPKLSKEHKKQLEEMLIEGSKAHGYEGERWTRKRVQRLIQKKFDVTYGLSQVGNILKSMKMTWQKPVKQAVQRDEVKIAQWRDQEWPELKKSHE